MRQPHPNAIESLVCQAFAEVLLLESVHPDEDFLDLGGDSLRAMQLPLHLERLLERPLAANPLQDARTPRDIAALLLEQAYPPDVYFLPGIDGGTSSLDVLRPAFHRLGLSVQALLYPCDLGLRTIPEIAAWVRRYIPRAPSYRLVGYSFGGTVAFELAQQLDAPIAFLGIIDQLAQPSPVSAPPPGRWQRIQQALRLAAATTPRQWLESYRYRRARVPLEETPFVQRNRAAAGSYRPRPYAGPLSLISTGDSLGWDVEDLRVFPYKGTHNIYDPLVTPAVIDALAAALQAESVKKGYAPHFRLWPEPALTLDS